jgi:curved DNA-binding protein CbpA
MKWRNRKPQLSDEVSRLSGLEPHEVLKINPDAGVEEIKRAYRQMVKVYHPDKSDPFLRKHNVEVIKIINQAYERLMLQWEGGK